MANPNISALLQQLTLSSQAGSAVTSSFSFVSGGTGTFSGGGAMRVRLVCSDKYGSQSKCRHWIGSTSGPSSEKVCMANKAEGAKICGTRHQGDKVALLEADALYIRVARNQILGRPFLPCSILLEDHAKELLADSKELVDWQTLFADILRASKDSSHATVDAILVERWQENILRMPLRTPGRIRTRLLASSAKDSEISADKRSPGIHAQDTPDIDVDFTVEPETYKEWNQVGLPPSLVSTIQSMEQGLDKSNTAILGLHRDFSAMGSVMADDVHALDCRVERLQSTVGLLKAVPGFLNGNVWDVLQAMGETNATNPTSSVAAIDVQTRLGSLAASATAAQQELSSL
jgi:hypothetical protein